MPQAFRSIRVLGTGSALPSREYLSAEIDARLGRPPGWVEARVGIARRFICQDEDQIELACEAARAALAAASREPVDIDIVIFAAAVPYQSIPSTAPLVQRRLGIPEGACAAFDVNSTCLSFITAMDILTSLMAGGTYRNGLIVSAELASRGLPWDSDPLAAALFGDGAAAAVCSPGDGVAGIAASRMETYPEYYDDCRLGAGGTRYDFHRDGASFAANSLFEMDGRALFRHTIQLFEPFLDRLLDQAGWRRDDVDLVIPHQASPLALAHLAERCGFGTEKVVSIIRDRGNQIAASMPSALDAATRDGRLMPGMKALMLGTSAGLSLGGIAFKA